MNNNALATKPHYPILDGLRGIAAIIVVTFHLTEPLATGHLDNLVNHGYLAVDFFFLAWISNHKGITIAQAWPYALLILTGGIVLAYAALKWYDEPVRRWLRKKLG